MEARDKTIETNEAEAVEIISAKPIAEAAVSDVIEAVPGVVVAEDNTAEKIVEEAFQAFTEDEPVPLHKNGHLKHIIECLMFVSNEPLTSKQIAETLSIDEAAVTEAVNGLEASLDNSGLQLMKIAGGYQLCTRPEYSEYCALLLQPSKRKLSKAALETLAVVAYRQPCTVPEVEAVRGVSVGGVIKTLTERGLVKEAGHKQTPGKPILYTTTPEFLEYFGLDDISELPDIDMLAVEEIKALESQKELFQHPSAGEDIVTAENNKE